VPDINPDTNPPPYERIRDMVTSVWQARALAVVAELGLPDLVADGPRHIDELASHTNTNPVALLRLLRALETVGVFTEAAPGVFFNSATSAALRAGTVGSERSMVLQSVGRANTAPPPSISDTATPALVAAYDWGQFRQIVDVADPFDVIPPDADAYVLREILHHWADPAAAAIVAFVRRVMKPKARLIVIESVLPEWPAHGPDGCIEWQTLLSVHTYDRTESEHRILLAYMGFALEAVIDTDCPLSLLVASM
jgi:O-methyltransferase domain